MRLLLIISSLLLYSCNSSTKQDNYRIYTQKAYEDEQVRQQVDYYKDSLLHAGEAKDTL